MRSICLVVNSFSSNVDVFRNGLNGSSPTPAPELNHRNLGFIVEYTVWLLKHGYKESSIETIVKLLKAQSPVFFLTTFTSESEFSWKTRAPTRDGHRT